MFQLKKKSRIVKDLLELLYHDMTCMSSIMRADVLTPNFDDANHEISEEGYQVQLELYVFEGPYRGGKFNLGLTITKDYPFKGPLFYSREPIWHPNIDLTNGQIFLPIEWSPVLKLYSMIFALQLLFLEPSDESIVNFEAGQLLHSNSLHFEETAQSILHGGLVGGVFYPNYIRQGQNCWCKDQIPFLKNQSNSPVKCDLQRLNISSSLPMWQQNEQTSPNSNEICKKRGHSDWDEEDEDDDDCDGRHLGIKRRIIDMEISSADDDALIS